MSSWTDRPSSLPRDIAVDNYFGRKIDDEDRTAASHNMMLLLLVIMPPLAVLGLGVGLKWSAKGFTDPEK
jgi:hypothetical protein